MNKEDELIMKKVKKALLPIVLTIISLGILQFLFQQICPMKLMLGIPCPGCGMTRATLLLLQGKFLASMEMNPFLIPYVSAAIVYIWCQYSYGETLQMAKLYIIIILVASIVFYGWRMYMYFPNKEPMTFNDNCLLWQLKKVIAVIMGK